MLQSNLVNIAISLQSCSSQSRPLQSHCNLVAISFTITNSCLQLQSRLQSHSQSHLQSQISFPILLWILQSQSQFYSIIAVICPFIVTVYHCSCLVAVGWSGHGCRHYAYHCSHPCHSQFVVDLWLVRSYINESSLTHV